MLPAFQQFLLAFDHAHQVSVLALLAAQHSAIRLAKAALGGADLLADVRGEPLLVLFAFKMQLVTRRSA